MFYVKIKNESRWPTIDKICLRRPEGRTIMEFETYEEIYEYAKKHLYLGVRQSTYSMERFMKDFPVKKF